MPRDKELFTKPYPELQKQHLELQTLGAKNHALNVLVSEFDFKRLRMLGEIHDETVSGVIRQIVDKTFEDLEAESPDKYAVVTALAIDEMNNALERKKRRALYLQNSLES